MNKLYVYEHCPYCTKARMIFGLKDIPVELEYLDNDDENTPIKMTGVKMLPIFKDDEGVVMNESLDIIEYIDSHFYPKIIESSVSSVVSSWLSENSTFIYKLCMPRWPRTEMPEFKTHASRDYFSKKKEASIGNFEEHLALTNEYLDLLTPGWDGLVVGNEEFFDIESRPVQVGDIHLFASLKCLTVVKDLEFPPLVQEYMNRLSIASRVSLDSKFNV